MINAFARPPPWKAGNEKKGAWIVVRGSSSRRHGEGHYFADKNALYARKPE
ncbi:MAG: hypothetical protein GYA24_00570 [Candidatus Lokiarchaeota archaeon]|nr:hypothetical protein [Candidatus Lokiarchaeota archaeon]